MTSLIRCFCPLYVVKMAILSAGYPIRRMYMKIATAYSASPRFYKNKQDKKWRNCFSNNGFTDFRVRFLSVSQIRILLCHLKTDICFFTEIQITGLSIQMTYADRWIIWILPNTGFFGNMIRSISVPWILKEWLYHQVQRVYQLFDYAAHRCRHIETPNMD